MDQNQSIWRRIDLIEADDPSLDAETWLTVQPCKTYSLFGKAVLITQPSSTFWVYALGVLTTLLGVYFIASEAAQTSRLLWGLSLVLWGVGALLAGTSYQAFGYQLKCANRPEVVWTSWWEVVYLVFQQVSMSVMFMAVAYSCLPETGQVVSVVVATVVSIVYLILVGYGAFKPVKFLITFEFMVHVCTPFVIVMAGFNSWRYLQTGESIDLALLGVWIGLVLTMWLFNVYMTLGLTEKLWKQGRWFSENDVLHVALIAWVVYIALIVEPMIMDFI